MVSGRYHEPIPDFSTMTLDPLLDYRLIVLHPLLSILVVFLTFIAYLTIRSLHTKRK